MTQYVIAKKGSLWAEDGVADEAKARELLALKYADRPELEVMTAHDWHMAALEGLLTGAERVTEDRWHEMLNVLPPERWRTENGIESFLMCEFTWDSVTNQFGRMGDKYICKPVDVRNPSTFITAEDFQEANA